ncbi:hypothetical protein MD273_18000 [Marinobacter pelagius]|uniref:hypothetical protein n=1 Tax=Marinobacter sp. C7 TaxID=2951363 RepID=UPI001EEFF2ED|nr:hypothetical protein [Marinobacter sp. C7]MCG7201634.1 hypothetical protein [Marinobacter sp. C7]
MGSATVPTRQSAAAVLLPDIPAPTRKDLLGLAAPAQPFGTPRPDVTRKWLENLGFTINRTTRGHWILTLGHPTPEIHLYSEGELEQFARYKAHDYADRILEETDR